MPSYLGMAGEMYTKVEQTEQRSDRPVTTDEPDADVCQTMPLVALSFIIPSLLIPQYVCIARLYRNTTEFHSYQVVFVCLIGVRLFSTYPLMILDSGETLEIVFT